MSLIHRHCLLPKLHSCIYILAGELKHNEKSKNSCKAPRAISSLADMPVLTLFNIKASKHQQENKGLRIKQVNPYV